jgi:transcriptional regulator with XRE-family HTH domain
MPKPASRAYSFYSRHACSLLGQLIRQTRIEKKLTIEELAERAGISRGLVARIEKGDLGCAIGAVFETAAVVGVRLFDADQTTIDAQISTSKAMLTLLPKRVRNSTGPVKDDF